MYRSVHLSAALMFGCTTATVRGGPAASTPSPDPAHPVDAESQDDQDRGGEAERERSHPPAGHGENRPREEGVHRRDGEGEDVDASDPGDLDDRHVIGEGVSGRAPGIAEESQGAHVLEGAEEDRRGDDEGDPPLRPPGPRREEGGKEREVSGEEEHADQGEPPHGNLRVGEEADPMKESEKIAEAEEPTGPERAADTGAIHGHREEEEEGDQGAEDQDAGRVLLEGEGSDEPRENRLNEGRTNRPPLRPTLAGSVTHRIS